MTEQQALPFGANLEIHNKYVLTLMAQLDGMGGKMTQAAQVINKLNLRIAALEGEKLELQQRIDTMSAPPTTAIDNTEVPEFPPASYEAPQETSEVQFEVPPVVEPTESQTEEVNLTSIQDDPSVIMDVPTGNDLMDGPDEPFPKAVNNNSIVNNLYTNQSPPTTPDVPSDKSEMASKTIPSWDGGADEPMTPPNLGDI